MYRIIDSMVLMSLLAVGQTMSFNCTSIKVGGARHHTAYNGKYTKTGDECRDGDTYRQEKGNGLLVQRSRSNGWVVVANPQMETCPNTTDSNIRLIGKDEVNIPSMVVSMWSEFVNSMVTPNNELLVQCDDTFTHVTCTHSLISSMQLCPWGSKIKITEAYYFTDGTAGKQTCNADNVKCSSTFTNNELKSLRSYCEGLRACLPWVVPSVRHRNCERNSNIQCDVTTDTIMDGLVMAFQCKKNRGCKNLRLVNTTYHSDLPSTYSRDDGSMCNGRNVYSNGDYYLWYSTRSGVPEGWYFGQQISGFQCDGLVGTVATTAVQYPEDARVWYEGPNRQDIQQTEARVICKGGRLRQFPDPCSLPTIAATSTTTVVDYQITTIDPVITEEESITDEDTAITLNDGTHTSQQMETDFSDKLSIYTTTIYNDKSKMAKPNDETSMAVIAGAAAGGGGIVIIVVIIAAVLLIRRRKNKANPEMANHDQEMVKIDTEDIGMEPGYAEVLPTGIVLESETTETQLQSKLKDKNTMKKVKESDNKKQNSRADKKARKKKSMEDQMPNGQVKNKQTAAESPNDLYAVVKKPKKNVADDFGEDNDDVVIENTLYGQPDEDDVIGKQNYVKNRTAAVVDNDINDSGVHLDPDNLELDIEPCYAELRNQSPIINTEHVPSTKPEAPKGKFENLLKKADKPEKQVEGKHKSDAEINDSDTEVGPQGDVYAVVQKPMKKQVRTKPPMDDDEDDVMVENTMYGAMEENVTPEVPKKHKGSKRNIVTMYADDVHTSNDDEQEVDLS